MAVRLAFYTVAFVLAPAAGVVALFAAHPASAPRGVLIVAGLPALLTAVVAGATRRGRRDAWLGVGGAAVVGLGVGIAAVLWVVSQIGD